MDESELALDRPEYRYTGSQRLLAAAFARLGRKDEAAAAAGRFVAIHPNFSAARWGRKHPFRDDADRESFLEGYRLAGLPE